MSSRQAWAGSPMPAVIVPAAIGAGLAAEMRERTARVGYTRYALLDRASYEVGEAPPEGELFETLGGIASEISGRKLAVAEARVLRLGPGDYLLVRHDRVHDERPIEIVLDLSEVPVPGAEVHYRHRGQVYFVFPTTPGALALVERGPTVMCNHTYVSKRQPASVVRLVALLRDEPG